mgnify:CR=1 FL=1
MSEKKFVKAKIFFEKGINFYLEGSYKFAENAFRDSLDLAPNRLSIINNLIKVYVKTQQIEKLKILIDKHNHLSNEKEIQLGLAYYNFLKENFDDSITIINQIRNDNEIKNQADDLLAQIYIKKKLFLKALKIFKEKLRIEKKNFVNYYNIGCLFFDIGRADQAYYYFNKSLEINPKNQPTIWNKGLCELTQKRLKDGFKLYEYRFLNIENEKKFTDIRSPKNLLDITDKKILVWDEMGLGDAVMFSRFIIDLTNYTKKITFVVNKKLTKLLSNLSPYIKVVDYENLNSLNYDFQIPVCSLPKLLNISKVEDINFYELSLIRNKNFKIELDNSKLNIGVAWSGNPDYVRDEYRSIPFDVFKKVLNFKNINFYKIFKDTKNSEYLNYNSYPNLFDCGNKSIYEVSNIMKDLDLIISSDTSIIHIAGILNVKSFLLLNFNSEWRWFNDKKKTIWYPSIDIIKQNKFNSWDNVFIELKSKIEKLIRS